MTIEHPSGLMVKLQVFGEYSATEGNFSTILTSFSVASVINPPQAKQLSFAYLTPGQL